MVLQTRCSRRHSSSQTLPPIVQNLTRLTTGDLLRSLITIAVGFAPCCGMTLSLSFHLSDRGLWRGMDRRLSIIQVPKLPRPMRGRKNMPIFASSMTWNSPSENGAQRRKNLAIIASLSLLNYVVLRIGSSIPPLFASPSLYSMQEPR